MKKVAILLAGCGCFDGSEIHESVLTMLSIKQLGHNYQCFSINDEQYHTVNHLTQVEESSNRNMLVESARIARGNIKEIAELCVDDYDALIIPGGNGIAFSLFDFALKGPDFSVRNEVKEICLSFTNRDKPVGFICIAPVMIAKIYSEKVKMTIGNDSNIAAMVDSMGMEHNNTDYNEVCVDEKHKIATVAAYMLATDIGMAYQGIYKLVEKVVELI